MIKTAHGNPIDAGLFAPRVTTKRHGKPGGKDFSPAAAHRRRLGPHRAAACRRHDAKFGEVRP